MEPQPAPMHEFSRGSSEEQEKKKKKRQRALVCVPYKGTMESTFENVLKTRKKVFKKKKI